MANLKEIRTRITSVEGTMQITSAMKMVSASKLKRAQNAIVQMRPFAEKFNTILGNVSSTLESSDHALMQDKEVKKVLLVALVSNRGLCGGFNSSVTKRIKSLIAGNSEINYEILPVGKKAFDAFKHSNNITKSKSFSKNVSTVWDNLNYQKTIPLAESLMNSFINGEYDQISIVYNSFKNAAIQELKEEQFLPLVASKNNDSTSNIDYIFEPGREEIVVDLIPNSLKIKLYESMLDSFASEHGARMTAMHKATDNAMEMKKELTLFYNKARQAAITNEILEIVAGAEALGG
jgi:F-type H+-transporting ATPase subunit gamma